MTKRFMAFAVSVALGAGVLTFGAASANDDVKALREGLNKSTVDSVMMGEIVQVVWGE